MQVIRSGEGCVSPAAPCWYNFDISIFFLFCCYSATSSFCYFCSFDRCVIFTFFCYSPFLPSRSFSCIYVFLYLCSYFQRFFPPILVYRLFFMFLFSWFIPHSDFLLFIHSNFLSFFMCLPICLCSAVHLYLSVFVWVSVLPRKTHSSVYLGGGKMTQMGLEI